jgi:hypothetical protein
VADEILLDLTETESVVLDLDEAEEVSLNFTEEIITLEVVGEVGPRGAQGIQGEQGIQGIQGEIGPVGPEGPPGTSSGFFRYHQAAPALQWLFTHTLPYPPAVTTVDSAGSALYGDLLYVDDSTIQIDFSVPTAGYAYCT